MKRICEDDGNEKIKYETFGEQGEATPQTERKIKKNRQ